METVICKMKLIFKKINEHVGYRILIFVVLMAILFPSYFSIKLRLERRFVPIEDDFTWVYQIDEVKEHEETLMLSGWAFPLNKDSQSGNCEVILNDIETGENVFLSMDFIPREDVNNYFLCEYDYTNSGYVATVNIRKLDLENATYEILLRPFNAKEAYRTGIYYVGSEMVYTNPQEFVGLETQGTDLEIVTSEGILRVYRPDVGMYVYQYEGELYWIAEEWYGFVNEDSNVEFQMTTTQVNNLPEERLQNNWDWSNLWFSFKSKEVQGWNTGKYRVAKYALPKEYSITKIWTGNYIDNWIWVQYFRPFYVFE